MDGDFQTVFNLLETGYRGVTWALAGGALLAGGAVYVVRLKPDGGGERLYRNLLAVVLGLGVAGFAVYQARAYGTYLGLAAALEKGEAERTVGHVTAVFAEGYFLVFDVDGKRLRTSRYEWPYRLGFHPGDFTLTPTLLVRVDTVEDVVVRLGLHRAHLSE